MGPVRIHRGSLHTGSSGAWSGIGQGFDGQYGEATRGDVDVSGSTAGVVSVGGAAAVLVWAVWFAGGLPVPVLIAACAVCALVRMVFLFWAIRSPDPSAPQHLPPDTEDS